MIELVSLVLQTVSKTLSSELTKEGFKRFRIWVAVATGAGERVASRFLDLASSAEIRAAREGLRQDCLELFPGCDVLAQFNEYDPLFRRSIPEG